VDGIHAGLRQEEDARQCLLLQSRVQVLNGDLRKTFGRWFPGMKGDEQPALKKAA
jgi:hypothetical protein